MLRLVGVVISVGLADSLNPSTIGPALYLATVKERVWRVTQFTLGVFGVSLAGGLLVTIGPGRLLIGLIPHPREHVRHAIELLAGIALVLVAIALWLARRRLTRRELPMRSVGGHSAFIAGASIMAIELPTAAPYIAVMAAIAASDASLLGEVWLLVLYNLAFALPLFAIVVVLLVAGDRAAPWLHGAQTWLQRWWPVALAALLFLAGIGLTAIGAVGLARE
jgi:cytochrome c biogenesis protein CcdA